MLRDLSFELAVLSVQPAGLSQYGLQRMADHALCALFGEARRRTKVIPHAFGERAVLKLMFASLLRASASSDPFAAVSALVPCCYSAPVHLD